MSALGHTANAGWSDRTSPWGRYWFAALWLAAALVALALAGGPAPATPAPRLTEIEWAPAIEDQPPGDIWRPIQSAPLLGNTVWIRAKFHLTAAQADSGGASLMLSGLFSADARVNGIRISQSKGTPGFSAARETPGPIDAALPMGGAARAGNNELLVLLSAHNVRYRPENLIHDAFIAMSGASPRRPLEHYGLAIAQAGVLLAMALALILSGLTRGAGTPYFWAGGGALFLLAALAGESMRAFWSYPYSLHIVRMLAIWVALTGFAGAMFAAVAARWTQTLPWRALLLALLAIGARMATTQSFDSWDIASIAAFGAGSLWLLWPAARNGDAAALALTGVIVATLALALVAPIEFLDNGVYVLGALAFLPLTLEALGPVRPAQGALPRTPVFACEDGAVPVNEIVWIRAAGNYLEIKCVDRPAVLLRGGLSRIGDQHAPLLRVHRSYAVNLDFTDRIVAKTGSRYELVLRDGTRIPVSRREATALRKRLRAFQIGAQTA